MNGNEFWIVVLGLLAVIGLVAGIIPSLFRGRPRQTGSSSFGAGGGSVRYDGIAIVHVQDIWGNLAIGHDYRLGPEQVVVEQPPGMNVSVHPQGVVMHIRGGRPERRNVRQVVSGDNAVAVGGGTFQAGRLVAYGGQPLDQLVVRLGPDVRQGSISVRGDLNPLPR